ncbi:hypothetical protein VCRA2119O147_160043 [Vibrio crassostreae]|nr:hypothetical protein VCRA2119O147_160043 [Vibrio crassostreae]CAK2511215.1 hypothetical protein VCRA2113O360_40252 [Vibrio crassostreae]
MCITDGADPFENKTIKIRVIRSGLAIIYLLSRELLNIVCW